MARMIEAAHARRSFVLSIAVVVLSMACGGSQKPVGPKVSPALAAKLDAFDARLEAKRKELGIPGLAVVIVKDDKIIYLAGKGMRDVEKQLPVTEDTVFAIGSTTKAFTAMLALMAVEAGKLSLDDPPSKCLPYFKLADPEADAKVTLRHLLSHTSGIAGTDIGWMTGKISGKEAIELIGKAQPIAEVGKEFHYQNVMFLAAGECIASAMGMSYTDLLQQRIFDPIAMKTANASVAKTLGLPGRAVGYRQAGADEQLRPVEMRPLDNIAPAGAINASARDMGQWLRVMLARGKHGSERLISEESFAQLFTAQIDMGPNNSYGLGWSLEKWNDGIQASHTGGIDGFVTLVALLPEKNIGFGLFTNIQNADIHGYVSNEVFALIAGEGAALSANDTPAPRGAADEAGIYGMLGGLKLEVTWDGSRLSMKAPNKPLIELEYLEGRRYRLGPPAPARFFVTFSDSDSAPGKAEVLLEQPNQTLTLPRLTEEVLAEAANRAPPPELAELVGSYMVPEKNVEVRLLVVEGRVALSWAGMEPAVPLVPAGKDSYTLEGMPDGFAVEVQRDAAGGVSSLLLKNPKESDEAVRVAGSGTPSITLDELVAKAAAAHGAEALAKHRSTVVHNKITLVNQGLEGEEVIFRRSPNLQANEAHLNAFGREIATFDEVFDGRTAVRKISFLPSEMSAGEIDVARAGARFNPWIDWKTAFDEVRVSRASKVGDEDVYVVTKKRASGVEITEFYSQDSFLLLESIVSYPGERGGPGEKLTYFYSDYRDVGGFQLPYRTEQHGGGLGKVVYVVDKVELDVDIPDDKFSAVRD